MSEEADGSTNDLFGKTIEDEDVVINSMLLSVYKNFVEMESRVAGYTNEPFFFSCIADFLSIVRQLMIIFLSRAHVLRPAGQLVGRQLRDSCRRNAYFQPYSICYVGVHEQLVCRTS